ncbi:hypothetical protein DFH11DRAFT_1879278 [Phellopilus nigrolimitatus]|nr:hypothetical protein DFH11DRAFT_1879278 [Phellopilus nigrolimitatus]
MSMGRAGSPARPTHPVSAKDGGKHKAWRRSESEPTCMSILRLEAVTVHAAQTRARARERGDQLVTAVVQLLDHPLCHALPLPSLLPVAAAIETLHALNTLRGRKASILDIQCKRVLVPGESSFGVGGGGRSLFVNTASAQTASRRWTPVRRWYTARGARERRIPWGRNGAGSETANMMPGERSGCYCCRRARVIRIRVTESGRGWAVRCDGAGPAGTRSLLEVVGMGSAGLGSGAAHRSGKGDVGCA